MLTGRGTARASHGIRTSRAIRCSSRIATAPTRGKCSSTWPGRHNHFPTLSPDGRWIYFVNGVLDATAEWDLWRVASDGGTPERLTYGNGYIGYPTPLDSRTVLFVGEDAAGSGPWLWALDVERKSVRRISVGLERYMSVAASADRRRLVAAVANPSANLWSVPILERIVDESQVQAYPVTNVRALAPRIAGNALYFLSSLGGGDGLWRVEAGQAAEIWRGSAGALLEPPGVSADGRRVAVVVRRSGRQSLWLLAADGAEQRLLTETIDVRGAPSWSPDGHGSSRRRRREWRRPVQDPCDWRRSRPPGRHRFQPRLVAGRQPHRLRRNRYPVPCRCKP